MRQSCCGNYPVLFSRPIILARLRGLQDDDCRGLSVGLSEGGRAPVETERAVRALDRSYNFFV